MARKQTKKEQRKTKTIYKKRSFRVIIHSALDHLVVFSERIGLAYLVVAILLIAAVVILAYCLLPEEIRTVCSSLVGGLFSLILIPMLLEKQKQATEHRRANFEINKDAYLGIVRIAAEIYVEKDETPKRCALYRNKLRKFVSEQYLEMTIHFPSNIYWAIHMIDISLDRNQMDLARYYAEKSMSLIRKHAGMVGEPCNSARLTEAYVQKGGAIVNDTSDKKTN